MNNERTEQIRREKERKMRCDGVWTQDTADEQRIATACREGGLISDCSREKKEKNNPSQNEWARGT